MTYSKKDLREIPTKHLEILQQQANIKADYWDKQSLPFAITVVGLVIFILILTLIPNTGELRVLFTVIQFLALVIYLVIGFIGLLWRTRSIRILQIQIDRLEKKMNGRI